MKLFTTHRHSLLVLSALALAVIGACLYFGGDALQAVLGGLAPGLLIANGPVAVEVKDLLEGIGNGVKELQTRSESELAAMRKRIDLLESRNNTRGLFAGSDGVDGRTDTSLQLRTAGEFAEHYKAAAGREDLDGITLKDFVRGAIGQATTDVARKALAVGTDSSGGYAVPARVMPEILQAMVPESSLLSAGAGVVPVSDGAKSYTTAAVNVIPSAAWRLENGDVAESEPTFRAVVAAPQSLAFFFKVSRELLADAPNMDAALTIAIGQAFAKALDLAGLRGSGTPPTPRGLANTSGINPIGNGAAGASLATTKFSNFFSAVQAILEANGPMPTAAIMSPRSRIVLGGLVDSTGQPLQVPPMLTGMKMLTTSQIPNNLTVGASNDCSEIYVGDFRRMAFIMREQVSIQPLNELFAGKGQIAFIGHVRADVAVWYPQAFAAVTGVRP